MLVLKSCSIGVNILFNAPQNGATERVDKIEYENKCTLPCPTIQIWKHMQLDD